METLTIGRLAARARVNVETIRYYERRGLIARPARRGGGYRHYTPAHVTRIRFIKRTQQLGFSLDEIADLLGMRVRPGAGCADVKKHALAKIEEIEGKIAALETMKSALARLARRCKGTGPSSNCPLLDALEHQQDDED